MTKTKEMISPNVEKIEKVDEILTKVEEYKDAFLEAKNLLVNSKAEWKTLTKKKLEKIFEIANNKKDEVLKLTSKLKEKGTSEEFWKVRDSIEEKSRIPGIEKWIYMELRAWLLNLKDKEL